MKKINYPNVTNIQLIHTERGMASFVLNELMLRDADGFHSFLRILRSSNYHWRME